MLPAGHECRREPSYWWAGGLEKKHVLGALPQHEVDDVVESFVLLEGLRLDPGQKCVFDSLPDSALANCSSGRHHRRTRPTR